MVDEPSQTPEPHKRRPRYKGTHPRRFEEKYKERAPELYPEMIEHVRGRGMTPAGQHVSIMVDEVLAALGLRPGERGVDATLGYGGHARRILEAITPGGTLLGLDVDGVEAPKTEARLRAAGFGPEVLQVRRTNFAGLRGVLFELGWESGVDFFFADLGLSSMQIDDPARGFTFKFDGPLDMRMNPARGLSAAEWLKRATFERLSAALTENADEPRAATIARHLCALRGELESTRALAEAVAAALGPRASEDDIDGTVRRVFQALRIEVNDEFGALDTLLRQIGESLRPGGRAVFLSFHSGEDRRIKQLFRAGFESGFYAEVSDEVQRPSPEERRSNPRSAPAKLRWARRA